MTTNKKIAVALVALVFGLGAYLRWFEGLSIGAGTGPISAVVVEDAAHRTPATGAVLASPKIRDYAKQKGIAWRAVDFAASGPDLAEVQWAVEAAAGKKLPILAVRAGSTPRVYALPTADDTLALLKRLAG